MIRNSKGVSGIIASIFLVMIIIVIYFNVFMFLLNRSATYQEAISDVNQRDLESSYEKIVVSNVNYTVAEDKVLVEGTVKNNGPIPAQLIILWVLDKNVHKYGYNNSICINLKPGETYQFSDSNSLIVNIDGASSTHEFSAWFVTSRGNLVPFQEQSRIIIASLAKGLGYIAMDFDSFRYYLVENLSQPYFSFQIPVRKETVLGVYLTNLDSSHRTINLTEYSCIWVSIPDSNAMSSWKITKVVNGTIVNFDYVTLEYGRPTLVYFGPNSASQLADNIAAANILLYGKIGSEDYGQNIPFIAIYLSGK